jgi:hypothetical protein
VSAACKPICKPDAPERDKTEETEQNERAVLVPVRRGHRIRERSSETGKTYVALLITQRSRVQIPPPLPGKTPPGDISRGVFHAAGNQIAVTIGPVFRRGRPRRRFPPRRPRTARTARFRAGCRSTRPRVPNACPPEHPGYLPGRVPLQHDLPCGKIGGSEGGQLADVRVLDRGAPPVSDFGQL